MTDLITSIAAAKHTRVTCDGTKWSKYSSLNRIALFAIALSGIGSTPELRASSADSSQASNHQAGLSQTNADDAGRSREGNNLVNQPDEESRAAWIAKYNRARGITLKQRQSRVSGATYESLSGGPGSIDVWIRTSEDPDWVERLRGAWTQTLEHSYRQKVGVVPALGGELDVGELTNNNLINVVAGAYDVSLTVVRSLWRGDKTEPTEEVSHAFVILQNAPPVVSIQPMSMAASDEEIFLIVDSGMMAVGTAGAEKRLSVADPEVTDAKDVERLLINEMKSDHPLGPRWSFASTPDKTTALSIFPAGEGDGEYPLYNMLDSDGRTIGLIIDFLVDH